MRVCLLQHSEASPPGHFSKIFPALRIIRLDRGEVLPAISDFDLFISVGGDMNVDDVKKNPFLKTEAKLIEKLILEKKNFLGVCLGAELLAKVLGAKVHRGGCHERGWVEIIGTDLMMFSNHHDRFDLPNGAIRLATGKNCLNQMIRYGSATGIQFHPNSEEEIIRKIAASPVRKMAPGIQSEEEIIAGLRNLKAQHQWLKDLPGLLVSN